MNGLISNAIKDESLTSPNYLYILFEAVALILRTFKADP